MPKLPLNGFNNMLRNPPFCSFFHYLQYFFEFFKKPIKYSNIHTHKITNVNKQYTFQ